MADGAAFPPGQQTVSFSELVSSTVRGTFIDLEEMCNTIPDQAEVEKKLTVLKFLYNTRQRLVRLAGVTKWCRQICRLFGGDCVSEEWQAAVGFRPVSVDPVRRCWQGPQWDTVKILRQMPLVERCQQVIGTVSHHDTSFTQAADSLYFLHESLQQARAPLYDIPAAAEVLLTGRYNRLPKCIEELGGQSFLVGGEREATLQKLDTILRSRLLDVTLPQHITSVTVRDGQVICQVHGEFEVHLTLGYQGNLSYWRVLLIKLLVGERSGSTKLTEMQSLGLRDDLERRMAGADDPLGLLYSILHDFCIALVMDTLFRQARALRQGRWKDAIRFEAITDGAGGVQPMNVGQSTGQGLRPQADGDSELGSSIKSRNSPGLKIWYWLDQGKAFSGTELSVTPFLKIEPGPSQHIICSHHPSVIDPMIESEAHFQLDQCCIDVEQLLLRAISCNIHTRLLEIQRVMKSCPQLWRVEDDVILKPSFSSGRGDNYHLPAVEGGSGTGIKGEVGEEVLCLRAYGESYMTLGLGVRNGRFLVQSPSTLLRQTVLIEMEEALNHGLLTPVEVFMSLRSKSLLQRFASTATSLNLKVYDRGALAVKFPDDGPKFGADVLLLGFPNCGDTYFLSLQLDSNFLPSFLLLEAQQPAQSGRASLTSGPFFVQRWMKIEGLKVVEDVASLCLLDQGRSQADNKGLFGSLRGTHTFVLGHDEMDLEMSKTESKGHSIGRNGKSKADLHSLLDRIHTFPSTPVGRSNNVLSRSDMTVSEQQSGITASSQYLNGLNPMSFQGNQVSRVPSKAGWHPSVGGMLNGTMNPAIGPIASPRNSPVHRVSNVIVSPQQGDQDPLQAKSPMNLGDTAASPIDLDDENLTQLIDSISSKSGTVVPGVPTSFPLENGIPFNSSRLPRSQSRFNASKLLKNLIQGRMSSPLKPLLTSSNPQDCTGGSEWMEVDESVLTQSSPSISSPSLGPTSTNQSVQGRIPRGTMLMAVDGTKRKRAGTDLSVLQASVQGQCTSFESSKRRKIGEDGTIKLAAANHSSPKMFDGLDNYIGQSYMRVVAAANEGSAPVASYMAVLLQVVRRCRLCIKRARLSRQLEAQGLPYFEEIGHQNFPEQLRFKLPNKITSYRRDKSDYGCWDNLLLQLGKLGSDAWHVLVPDDHYKSLWDLQRKIAGNSWGAVAFAMMSESDSHMKLTHRGLILSYDRVEDDSVVRLVGDLQRLVRARAFVLGLKRLLEGETDRRAEENREMGMVSQFGSSTAFGEDTEGGEKKWEVMRRAFRVDAVGPLNVSFTFTGPIPGITVRFFVAWLLPYGNCTLHVLPDQLWPHTKDLEDFINGGDVALLLDNIRVMAGPLNAVSAAIRPAGMARAGNTNAGSGPSTLVQSTSTKAISLIGSPTNTTAVVASGLGQPRPLGSQPLVAINPMSQGGPMPSGPGRGSLPGPLPNSLLPTDVAIILRGRYWVRIVYRKQFSVDMRCTDGDQVWLQPSPPPRSGGPAMGGSLPCPQFRPFVMELVAASMNSGEAGSSQSTQVVAPTAATVGSIGQGLNSGASSSRTSMPGSASRTAITIAGRIMSGPGMVAISQGRGVPAGTPLGPLVGGPHVGPRNEFNPTTLGMGDDGGYGGAWVPLAALRKVLRNTLRYLGVLWLFAQFPAILREVLGSILSQNEGSLQSLDPEQPTLRFFIGNYLFAASMQRDKLILQAVNLTRFQQQQQQAQSSGPDSEYTLAELIEIGDFFQRRVASEPYDASRLASFVTMLTLPISVVREFLGLIAWKKDGQLVGQGQGMDSSQAPKPRIELCLETRQGQSSAALQEHGGSLSGAGGRVPKSSIRYNNQLRQVDFTLTVHFDANSLPFNISQAGGASWLPQCVAVRLRYAFGDMSRVSLVSMESSHGGRACRLRAEDWERCKEKVGRAVEISGGGSGQDQGRGRLRAVAESVQITLPAALQQLRKVVTNSSSLLTNSLPPPPHA